MASWICSTLALPLAGEKVQDSSLKIQTCYLQHQRTKISQPKGGNRHFQSAQNIQSMMIITHVMFLSNTFAYH